ncbi:MAG: peroxiredoxin [Xanthobacteraceae bacterium]
MPQTPKSGSAATAARDKEAQPVAGTKAPAFSLPRDGGGTVSLADYAGRKLVLYFYPRADTSGCTKEATDFSQLKTAFGRAGADILGVSADPVAALDRFKAKHKLAIALASDEQHKALNAYGVWRQKLLYGRKFMGTVRATFLIGPDQRIARVWPKVSVTAHAKEVLDAVKAIGRTFGPRPVTVKKRLLNIVKCQRARSGGFLFINHNQMISERVYFSMD